MVASRQVENPFYRGIDRQRGHSFATLAQVIGRTAIPFLCECIVPIAKRVDADLLDFAVSEVADVVFGKKKFRDSCKECGKANSEKTNG